MRFAEGNLGRVFILRLSDGDRLPEVLEEFAQKKNVANAVCFLIGGAKKRSRVVVGPKDDEGLPPEPMSVLLGGVHEICGVGTIFKNEGGHSKLHMHASFGRSKNTVAGCVRLGVDIWRIGEVVMLEILGVDARRAKDKETGFEFLEIG
jgi:predicted DNA-binding protein with PD1-like motif